MPRMLKLSLPARPVAPSAAPKRAGWRWTLTPEADEVADVGDEFVGHLLVGLDGDGGRNILRLRRDARCSDDDMMLAREPIGAVIVLRDRGRRRDGERETERRAGGETGSG